VALSQRGKGGKKKILTGRKKRGGGGGNPPPPCNSLSTLPENGGQSKKKGKKDGKRGGEGREGEPPVLSLPTPCLSLVLQGETRKEGREGKRGKGIPREEKKEKGGKERS